MIADTKGAPTVSGIRISDHRTVLVELGNCSRQVSLLTGKLFVPNLLHLEWRDGALIRCSLNGRQLRADGGEWLDGRRAGTSYLDVTTRPPFKLDGDTPDWVLDLIRIHEPE